MSEPAHASITSSAPLDAPRGGLLSPFTDGELAPFSPTRAGPWARAPLARPPGMAERISAESPGPRGSL